MKNAMIFLIFAVIAVLSFFYFNKFPQSTNVNNENILTKLQDPQPTPNPSPFAFKELTIPYLREREYKSGLGEMKKITDNGNFTSYLTNYDSDGLKINGLLTIPDSEKPEGGYPAIVFIHGYIPPTIYRTQEKYADYVNYLARNEFVVFKIDLRGNGDSEGEPGGAYYSSDYIIDTLNAYTALQNADFKSDSSQAPLINPKKIGLWGHSMGGNVVMRAFAVKPEIPAVVIWAGAGYTYKDLLDYRISDGSYRPPSDNTERQRKRQLLRDTYGEFNAENPFWKQVAITNYLNDLKGAVQLNHAVNDDVVSIEYSRNLNKILDGTSIIHELNEYQSGGHNITNPSFTPAMQNTVEFFNKYLKEK